MHASSKRNRRCLDQDAQAPVTPDAGRVKPRFRGASIHLLHCNKFVTPTFLSLVRARRAPA
jgi:hypothetical protein